VKTKKEETKPKKISKSKSAEPEMHSSNKTLVVVESPSKAKTINKYLGSKYIVEASVGHIKDLPTFRFGVDIAHDFTPKYEMMKGKSEIVKKLKQTAKESKDVMIATDPDREGEAIAAHIADEVKKVNSHIKRVIFNEITKSGVQKGLSEPREIDEALVMSQQARRVMDRIIGFKVSPFLSNIFADKYDHALSAGRVQSVALRLICEREREIEKFEPIEFWRIFAEFKNSEIARLKTELIAFANKKITNPSGSKNGGNDKETANLLKKLSAQHFIKDNEQAQAIIDQIKGIKEFKVADKKVQEISSKPSAPFTTSTLQQEAYRKLGFSNEKTMSVAQRLYEGVSVGTQGAIGLITYMRSDSVRISPEAQASAAEYIKSNFGKDYAPAKPPVYESKSQNVQDAHEAIRPTTLEFELNYLQQYLDKDQFALYKLIYQRYLASQMSNAKIEQTTLTIEAQDLQFRATGSVIKFDGYLKLYQEDQDSDDDSDDENQSILPPNIKIGDAFSLKKVESKQTFTKPPARFNRASLIKKLDELGIGRPSTYSSIVKTILDRGYIEQVLKVLKPTVLGFDINDALVAHFDNIFNTEFTAKMEDDLDKIAQNETDYLHVMKEFYDPFSKTLEKAQAEHNENTELKCPKCGSPLVVRVGRNGRFLGCSTYPDCDYTQPMPKTVGENQAKKELQIVEGIQCPICGKEMVLRDSKNGRFYGCIDYPKCKGTRPISTNVKCPKCGEGELVERYSSRTKKKFWSCSNYPKCDYLTNYEPVNIQCPKCGNYYLEIKYRKNKESGDWEKYYHCTDCDNNFEINEIEVKNGA
jgi:DNA topoisomerase-1